MSREFGRYPVNMTPKQWWGARAIFKPYDTYRKLDILRDRQNFEGDKTKSEEFMCWVNDVFLEQLDPYFNELYSNQNKVIKITSTNGQFEGEVSCQNSYGYLYIGCWEK